MSRLGRVAALATLALLAGHEPARAARSAAPAIRFARDGHARIPFDLRNGLVWVRGTIGRSDSAWIAVDTGASSSVMDDALARTLGLEVLGQHEAHGAGGSQPGSTVADVTIGLAGLSLHRDRLNTVSLAAISARGGRPMQLVLGYELFASCVVRFDYAAGIMDVWEPARAPKNEPGVVLPMTLESNHPYVEGTLEITGRAPLRGRFVIDTGSAAALLIAPDVAARDSLVNAFPRTLETLGRGVGGELRNRVGRAEAFRLGELRFDRPLVVVTQSTAGYITARGTVGNIGGQVLGRCRVTFDYPRRKVRFERGAGFERPFEADMSGASILRDSSGWSVRIVNPGTPASEAGLREGDVVTSVDGEPAERVDPATLRNLMQTEGRSVRVGIRRGAQEAFLTLVLRRLI